MNENDGDSKIASASELCLEFPEESRHRRRHTPGSLPAYIVLRCTQIPAGIRYHTIIGLVPLNAQVV